MCTGGGEGRKEPGRVGSPQLIQNQQVVETRLLTVVERLICQHLHAGRGIEQIQLACPPNPLTGVTTGGLRDLQVFRMRAAISRGLALA